MADISMCIGVKGKGEKEFICPLRDKCYRFTAPKSDRWQSYLVKVPYNRRKKDCDHFWNNAERKNG